MPTLSSEESETRKKKIRKGEAEKNKVGRREKSNREKIVLSACFCSLKGHKIKIKYKSGSMYRMRC